MEMKHTGLTKLLSAAAVIVLMTAFCACQNSGEQGISSYRDLEYPLFSEAPQKSTIENNAAVIDISNTSQGYIRK